MKNWIITKLNRFLDLERYFRDNTGYQRGIKRGKQSERERLVYLLKKSRFLDKDCETAVDEYIPPHADYKKMARADFISGYSTAKRHIAEVFEKLPL